MIGIIQLTDKPMSGPEYRIDVDNAQSLDPLDPTHTFPLTVPFGHDHSRTFSVLRITELNGYTIGEIVGSKSDATSRYTILYFATLEFDYLTIPRGTVVAYLHTTGFLLMTELKKW